MNNDLDAIFAILTSAAADASAKYDKWIVIDSAYAQQTALSTHDYQQVLTHILTLIEQYPELDYGGPGPFGTLIEAQPVGAYSQQLLDSLHRQPSIQVIGWLNRTMRMDGSERSISGGVSEVDFTEALRMVLQHPLASEDCKSFAELCLTDLAQ
ncbi:hypothetical protein [Chitinivorax sp. B]|uniref:hypothetical protein n=1 Tax=Chitinivorax sp. B TaxID=2502235 RepID=UPI0010F5C7A8|nr:hypothetical protein [Chitinivorax sp. B]